MKALLIFCGIMLGLLLLGFWIEFTIALGPWGFMVFLAPVIAIISIGIAYGDE